MKFTKLIKHSAASYEYLLNEQKQVVNEIKKTTEEYSKILDVYLKNKENVDMRKVNNLEGFKKLIKLLRDFKQLKEELY